MQTGNRALLSLINFTPVYSFSTLWAQFSSSSEKLDFFRESKPRSPFFDTGSLHPKITRQRQNRGDSFSSVIRVFPSIYLRELLS